MTKAYLSVSYTNRARLQPEIMTISETLLNHAISLWVFVDKYQFSRDQENEMMRQAFSDIDTADILIAEVSDKAIGVGIEMGYAAAKGKRVIYLRNTQTEHSTTAAGTADHIIFYSNTSDLRIGLDRVLQMILSGQD